MLIFLHVLPWVMLKKSAGVNGYAIDIMLVQLTENLRVDYLEQSFYSGTKWSLNSALMEQSNSQNKVKKSCQNETHSNSFKLVQTGSNFQKVKKSHQNDPLWPDLSPSVRYYKEENVDSTEVDPENGIIFKQWITSDNDQGDWTVHPPFITSMTIPPNTKTSGNWEYFWLSADAYYIVIEGKYAICLHMSAVSLHYSKCLSNSKAPLLLAMLKIKCLNMGMFFGYLEVK